MSRPATLVRWKQILAWVQANLAVADPKFGACKVPGTWKPRTKEERDDERFLRRILIAETAKGIGQAACPSFLIKGLASKDDEQKFGAVEIAEAFRRLAISFNLTATEAYQSRELADRLLQKLPVCGSVAEVMCATKFNIIRQSVEAAKQMDVLSDRKVVAKDAAREVLAEQKRLKIEGMTIVTEQNKTNDEDSHSCIFRRNGRVWEIRYDSEDSAFVQPRKGFEYICFLLANPGQGFSLKEIKDQIDPPPPSEHSDDDIDKEEDKDGELKPIYNTRSNLHLEDQKLSPEQLASVKKRLKEMQSERNNSKTSVTRREELDENIKIAQDYLRKVADKAGRSRKFANANEKYRTAVANNIENAIKNLPAELKDFAQHINDCVTKGFTLKYSPASTINWLTEDM